MADKSHLMTWVGMSIFLLAMVSTAGAQVVFVDDDATGANDGSSWADAHNYLQDALIASLDGDEIWVAEGTYRPDQGVGITLADRTATFELKDGVALYGGFPSGGGNWEDRDPIAYETILSGDLAGDDGPDFANNAENSYHVVTGSGTDATAIFDGFTITAGNASEEPSPHNAGGGMLNDEGSPTVTSCSFIANHALFGGAMRNSNSELTVTNCTFIGNNAAHDGGAMYSYRSSPTLTNCSFIGNSTSTGEGGAMANYHYCNPTLINCSFIDNTSMQGGGVMHNYRCIMTLINCTFSGNSAEGTSDCGGGILDEFCNSTLTNCTFSGNSAGLLGGGMCSRDSDVIVTNCIFWNNSAQYGSQIAMVGDSPCGTAVLYSDVQWGQKAIFVDMDCTLNWSDGNIDADPNFVDSDGPDDTAGTADDNLRLSAGSPCIDAGDNDAVPEDATDLDGDGDTTEPIPWNLDGYPRFLDDPNTVDTGNGTPPIVDMGAYEYIECLPTLDVKVNGQDGPIVVPGGQNVTFSFSLDAGSLSGQEGDWGLILISNHGTFPLLMATLPITDLPEIELPPLPLPSGWWALVFILDANPNGVLDSSLLWLDYALVIVSSPM